MQMAMLQVLPRASSVPLYISVHNIANHVNGFIDLESVEVHSNKYGHYHPSLLGTHHSWHQRCGSAAVMLRGLLWWLKCYLLEHKSLLIHGR